MTYHTEILTGVDFRFGPCWRRIGEPCLSRDGAREQAKRIGLELEWREGMPMLLPAARVGRIMEYTPDE